MGFELPKPLESTQRKGLGCLRREEGRTEERKGGKITAELEKDVRQKKRLHPGREKPVRRQVRNLQRVCEPLLICQTSFESAEPSHNNEH